MNKNQSQQVYDQRRNEKNAQVTCRIPRMVKERADATLENNDMTPSQFMRAAYLAVAVDGKMPAEILKYRRYVAADSLLNLLEDQPA